MLSNYESGFFPNSLRHISCTNLPAKTRQAVNYLFFFLSTLAPKIDFDELCMEQGHCALSHAKYLHHPIVQLG